MALFNDFDNDYVAHGNQIDYYVDSSVALLLFVFPGRLSLNCDPDERHNLHFLSMVGETGDKDEIVEAALAGEYLFSKRIHASARVDPAVASARLMTPGHWTEFTDRLRGVAQEWQNQTGRAGIRQVAIEQASNVNRALGSSNSSSTDKEKPAEILVEFVSACEETRDMELAMLHRVRSGQIVQPATDWPTDVFHVNPSEVDNWQRRLEETASFRDRKRTDAISIAQIEHLNKGYGRHRRACLVTADRAMHNAYYKYKIMQLSHFGERNRSGNFEPDIDRLAQSRFLAHFYLRHPAQFLASLNQADIDNRIGNPMLFNRTVSATDAWLAVVESSEIGALLLAMRALRDRDDAQRYIQNSRMRHAPDNLPDVRSLWVELQRQTAMVNRSLLAKRIEYAIKVSLEPDDQNADLQSELQSQQLELVQEIQDLGLYVAAREALGHLRDQLAGSSVEQRLPYALLSGFEELIGDNLEMKDVVADLAKDDRNLFDRLDEKITRKIESPRDSWQPLLFCAALAAWSSDWERVIWFGERARDSLVERKSSVAYDEAGYLVAVGRRMRLHENDYELADEVLSDTIERQEKVQKGPSSSENEKAHSRLVLARSMSERATLRMYEQLRRVLSREVENGEALATPLGEETMKEARKVFTEALKIVKPAGQPNNISTVQRRENRARDLVDRQSTLNLALYDFLCHVILSTDHAFPDETDDSILDEEIGAVFELLMTEAAAFPSNDGVDSRIANVQRLDLVILQIWRQIHKPPEEPSELQKLMMEAERLLAKINDKKTRAATHIDRILAKKMVERLRSLLADSGVVSQQPD